MDQVADILAKDAFFDETATLAQVQSELEKQIATAVTDLTAEQTTLLQTELAKWQTSPDWADLTPDDRAWVNASVEQMKKSVATTLAGLRTLLAHAYDLNESLRALGAEIAKRAEANRLARQRPIAPADKEEPTLPTEAPMEIHLYIPASLDSQTEVKQLIDQLQNYHNQMSGGKHLRLITIMLQKPSSNAPPTYN